LDIGIQILAFPPVVFFAAVAQVKMQCATVARSHDDESRGDTPLSA
jgi:hypothetical protein